MDNPRHRHVSSRAHHLTTRIHRRSADALPLYDYLMKGRTMGMKTFYFFFFMDIFFFIAFLTSSPPFLDFMDIFFIAILRFLCY